MKFTSAQLDDLKARHDVLDVAQRHTKLRKVAHHEWAGPCPVCDGRDRFHVNIKSQRWMCSHCTGRDSWGDVIALVQHVHGCDFKQALAHLGVMDTMIPQSPRQPKPQPKPQPKLEPKPWQSAEWQRDAQRTLQNACTALASDAGTAARAYLQQRGIEPATWRAWQLGYGPDHKGTAGIVLPWLQDDRVLLLNYRRLMKDANPRYLARPGGQRTLFGLHMLPTEATALVIVEGEINAISIWQACHTFDVGVCQWDQKH